MKKSVSIGYRLAFNYLKAKRYIECIEICRGILEVYPNYPNIEKEVLDKAIQALRWFTFVTDLSENINFKSVLNAELV
jgi:hypothetical protein